MAILRLFGRLWRREPEWHMALEWTQQLLEDARGFRVKGVQRSMERSQSEQAWTAKCRGVLLCTIMV